MQTFLPFEDFNVSARCLDTKRLRCQIKEAHQILNGQWQHHPTSKMWSRHYNALKSYFNAVLVEYRARGFDHKFDFFKVPGVITMPPWLGDKVFHLSHMVNLLRKDYTHYSQHFTVSNDFDYPEGYYWPMANGPKSKQGQIQWSLFARQNPDVFEYIIEVKYT